MEIDQINTPEWVGELCDKAMIIGFCVGCAMSGIVAIASYLLFAGA